MNEGRWIKAEAEYMLGMQRGRIQEWINHGFIKPKEPATQGVAAKFDRKNLYEIWFMNRAISFGASRQEAADMLDYIGKHKYLIRTETQVRPPLWSAGKWEPKDEGEVPDRIDGEHKIYMVVDLDMLISEVDSILP